MFQSPSRGDPGSTFIRERALSILHSDSAQAAKPGGTGIASSSGNELSKWDCNTRRGDNKNIL